MRHHELSLLVLGLGLTPLHTGAFVLAPTGRVGSGYMCVAEPPSRWASWNAENVGVAGKLRGGSCFVVCVGV